MPAYRFEPVRIYRISDLQLSPAGPVHFPNKLISAQILF